MPLLTHFFLGWVGLGLGGSSFSCNMYYGFSPTELLVVPRRRSLPSSKAEIQWFAKKLPPDTSGTTEKVCIDPGLFFLFFPSHLFSSP